MDAKTAFEVELALIDCFGLEHLANEIKGHDEDREMRWTDDLERQFTAKTFIEDENTPRFILIKINGYNINKNGGVENNGIYKAARWCWKIKPSRASKYPAVWQFAME